MTNITSYLSATAYGGISPLFNIAAAALCNVNGRQVTCGTGMFSWPFFVVLVVALVATAVVVVTIAGVWKVYRKAGQPGWAAIVPIYSFYIMLQIIRKPVWWMLLLLLPLIPRLGPIASLVFSIVVLYTLAKFFGKGVGYTIGLMLLPFIFWPLLGFGGATYQPPSQPLSPP